MALERISAIWRKALKRVDNSVKQKLSSLYYKYYVFPRIAPDEKLKNIKRITTAYNTIHIQTELFFYKIALREPNTIELEHKNYQTAVELYPEFRQYIPLYTFAKTGRFSFLKIENLLSVTDTVENLEASVMILDCLKTYGVQKKIGLSNLPNIERGIQIAKNYLTEAEYSKINMVVKSFLAENAINIGPVHYDFHFNNIMKSRSGMIKLIDFDCFNQSGIQAIDSLYYQIERKTQTQNTSWLTKLESYCLNDTNQFGTYVKWNGEKNILALLTFFNVIGQENRLFGINYSSTDFLKCMAYV